MEYLVLNIYEKGEKHKRFNDIRKWFFENYYKNNIQLKFFYEDKFIFDKNKSTFIISPYVFPLLSSKTLPNLFKKPNQLCVEGKNFIGAIGKNSDFFNKLNNHNLQNLLTELPKSEKILNYFNKNNIHSPNWHYVDPDEIGEFLNFLREEYFTWNLLNIIKLKNAKKYPQVIRYDGKNKLECKRIAQDMGINVPKTYYVFNNEREITDDKIDNLDNFIIKPSHLDSGLLIFKSTERKRLNAGFLRKRFRNFSNISSGKELNPLIRQIIHPKIIVEEVIFRDRDINKTPLELKFYIFDGKLRFVLLIDKSKKNDGFDFYDENFHRFDNSILSSKNTQVNAKHFEIKYFNEIKKDAMNLYEKFNKDLRNSFLGRFMRIDFYITKEKYYFGEFALFPNGGKGNNLSDKGKIKFVKWWLPEINSILNEPIEQKNGFIDNLYKIPEKISFSIDSLFESFKNKIY